MQRKLGLSNPSKRRRRPEPSRCNAQRAVISGKAGIQTPTQIEGLSEPLSPLASDARFHAAFAHTTTSTAIARLSRPPFLRRRVGWKWRRNPLKNADSRLQMAGAPATLVQPGSHSAMTSRRQRGFALSTRIERLRKPLSLATLDTRFREHDSVSGGGSAGNGRSSPWNSSISGCKWQPLMSAKA